MGDREGGAGMRGTRERRDTCYKNSLLFTSAATADLIVIT